MSFIDNEIFDNIVVGEYRDNDGNIIKGAYTTKDDGAVLVGINTFEKLLNGSGVVTPMSLEEAEKVYGKEIIDREIARRKARKKAKEEAELKAAMEKGEPVMFTQSGSASNFKPEKKLTKSGVATEEGYKEAIKLYGDRIRKEYKEELDQQKPVEPTTSGIVTISAEEKEQKRKDKITSTTRNKMEYNHCKIFIEIARGSTKKDVMEALNLSAPTINNAVKKFANPIAIKEKDKDTGELFEKTMDYPEYLFLKFPDFFRKIEDSRSLKADFKMMSTHDENGDLYRWKDTGNLVKPYNYDFYQKTLRGRKKKELEAKKRKQEIHEQAEKEANESSEAYMSGVDEKLATYGISRKQPAPKPEVTYDKDGDEIADMNNILSMFSGVASETQPPVPSATEQPRTDDTDLYIQKMRDRTKEIRRRESILPSKAVNYEDTDEWGEF